MAPVSPSARFFSNSRCFASASAMRLSIAANDSRVKGRNKLRSSSDIESESSVIVYMANNESLRFPRHGAHESRATDHSNIHGAMSKMTHLSSPIHYGDDESLLDFAAGTPMKNDEKTGPEVCSFSSRYWVKVFNIGAGQHTHAV